MTVAAIAGFVWGVCWLVVRQPALVASSPAPGHLFPHEITGRDGTFQVVYVSRSVHLTALISGFIFDSLLRLIVAALLVVTLGEAARLLIPGRIAFANRELAHYRAQVGPAGLSEEGLRYVAAWRSMWRRSWLTLTVCLLGLVAMWTKWPAAPGLLFWFGWLVVLFLGVIWVGTFRCPRCSNLYWSKAGAFQRLGFCSHCGLTQDSPPTADSHPDFAEWKRWS